MRSSTAWTARPACVCCPTTEPQGAHHANHRTPDPALRGGLAALGRAVLLSGRRGHRRRHPGRAVRLGQRRRHAAAPAACGRADAGRQRHCRPRVAAGRLAPACTLLALLCALHAVVVDVGRRAAAAGVRHAQRGHVRRLVAGQDWLDAPAGAAARALGAHHFGLYRRRDDGGALAPAVEHAVGARQPGADRLAGHRGRGLCTRALPARHAAPRR